MALSAQEVRVAVTGNIYVAPVGTTAPVDATTAPAAAWLELGYTTEDGVAFSKAVTRDTVAAWQSVTPVRTILSSQEVTLGFSLMQWNENTLSYYMGGTVTTNATSQFKLEIPVSPQTDERALLLDWIDGTIHYRLFFPRTELQETGEIPLTRTGVAVLPCTVTGLAPATGNVMATLFTDDEHFGVGV